MTSSTLKAIVIMVFVLGIGIALSPLLRCFASGTNRVGGIYRFSAPGIAPSELSGILTAGPASVETRPGFQLVMLLPDTALSAGDYRGGVVDLWAGRDLAPGTYAVVPSNALTTPGQDTVNFTLGSQGGYHWIADSGSLTMSESHDSLHGDFRLWLSPRCKGCEAERTITSLGRGSFSYPKR